MRDRQKEDEDETRQTAQEVRSTDGRDDGGVTSPTVAAVVSSPPPPLPPTDDGAAIFCRQEVNVQNSGEAKRETASSALRPTDRLDVFREGDHSPDTNSSSTTTVRERETTNTRDSAPEQVV